jgi:hypothetical protein
MVTKTISLAYVRMAVRRSPYSGQWSFAVSTPYRPVLAHDGTFLHGACVITTK